MTLVLKPKEIYAKRLSEGRLGMLEIAEGWATKPLGELIELLNGAPFDSNLFNRVGKGKPLIRIRDVGKDDTETWFSGDFDQKYLVTSGDVLVGLDGDFRVAEWHGSEALLNQRVCKLVPREDLLDKRFMVYHLAGWLDAIWEETSATTVKHLSSKTIQEIPFPLPPIEEQKRIVEALDDHLSRLDKAIADLKSAEMQIESFRASVFERCSGTIPLNGDQEWEKKRFGDIATIDSDLRPVDGLGHLPHIAPNNIEKGTGALLDYRTVQEDGMQSAKNYFRPGQIIYSKIRPYLNKMVLVDFEGLCSADMYPISTTQNSKWLLFAMLSNSFVRKTSGNQNRTVLPKINANSLRQIEILVPTFEIQERLVRETEAYLDFIDGIKTYVKRSQGLMESLRARVLFSAFTGQIEKVET